MLEQKIKKRLEALHTEQAEAEKQAQAATKAAATAFDDKLGDLTALAKAIGVKGEIIASTPDQSSIPYITFEVMDLPVALEIQGSILRLLLSNETIYSIARTPDHDPKEVIETALTDAIAQAALNRGDKPTADDKPKAVAVKP